MSAIAAAVAVRLLPSKAEACASRAALFLASEPGEAIRGTQSCRRPLQGLCDIQETAM